MKRVTMGWHVNIKVELSNVLTCKTHYAMFCITEMFKNIDLCKITKKINNDFAVGRYDDEVYVIF